MSLETLKLYAFGSRTQNHNLCGLYILTTKDKFLKVTDNGGNFHVQSETNLHHITPHIQVWFNKHQCVVLFIQTNIQNNNIMWLQTAPQIPQKPKSRTEKISDASGILRLQYYKQKKKYVLTLWLWLSNCYNQIIFDLVKYNKL